MLRTQAWKPKQLNCCAISRMLILKECHQHIPIRNWELKNELFPHPVPPLCLLSSLIPSMSPRYPSIVLFFLFYKQFQFTYTKNEFAFRQDFKHKLLVFPTKVFVNWPARYCFFKVTLYSLTEFWFVLFLQILFIFRLYTMLDVLQFLVLSHRGLVLPGVTATKGH